MRPLSCHVGWMFTTLSSLHGPFSISSCPCGQNCLGALARTLGTQSHASILISARKSVSINECPDSSWLTELQWSLECAQSQERTFQSRKSQIPSKSSGSKKMKLEAWKRNLICFLTDAAHCKSQVESTKLEAFDGNWLGHSCLCGFSATSVSGRELDGLERSEKNIFRRQTSFQT